MYTYTIVIVPTVTSRTVLSLLNLGVFTVCLVEYCYTGPTNAQYTLTITCFL